MSPTVENGTRNGRSEATFNGKPAVLIYVRKQSIQPMSSRPSTSVKALIPEIQRFMPAGIDVSILNDRTTSIARQRRRHAGHAASSPSSSSMMVVFVFLRRVTPTAAAGITVPLALAGTFAMMYLVRLLDRQHLADGARHLRRLQWSTMRS